MWKAGSMSQSVENTSALHIFSICDFNYIGLTCHDEELIWGIYVSRLLWGSYLFTLITSDLTSLYTQGYFWIFFLVIFSSVMFCNHTLGKSKKSSQQRKRRGGEDRIQGYGKVTWEEEGKLNTSGSRTHSFLCLQGHTSGQEGVGYRNIGIIFYLWQYHW